MSGSLRKSEWSGRRGQTKTTEVAVSPTHKTQFRHRIFLFPFLFLKKRMWQNWLTTEVKKETSDFGSLLLQKKKKIIDQELKLLITLNGKY